MYKICIPTYNRKELLSLKLLNDPHIELNYFVRQEQLDDNFYDFLKKYDRVNVISIGYGARDLGETRKRIIDWCIENKVDDCVMLDDGVYKIQVTKGGIPLKKLSAAIAVACEMAYDSPYSVGVGLRKIEYISNEGVKHAIDFVHNDRRACGFTPVQAVILRIDKMKELKLNYKSLDIVGYEDAGLQADVYKAGHFFMTPTNVTFGACLPNTPKPGGSHTKNESIEQICNERVKKFKQYVGDMHGVYTMKHYKDFMQSMFTFIMFDHKYFADILTNDVNRRYNKKIIEGRFMIDETL